MLVTKANLAAEDRAAQADVEKDIAFMGAAGPATALPVLALVEKTFDGGEDPRLTAGIAALWRIVSPTPGAHGAWIAIRSTSRLSSMKAAG